jgi:hypothetical protein
LLEFPTYHAVLAVKTLRTPRDGVLGESRCARVLTAPLRRDAYRAGKPARIAGESVMCRYLKLLAQNVNTQLKCSPRLLHNPRRAEYACRNEATSKPSRCERSTWRAELARSRCSIRTEGTWTNAPHRHCTHAVHARMPAIKTHLSRVSHSKLDIKQQGQPSHNRRRRRCHRYARLGACDWL